MIRAQKAIPYHREKFAARNQASRIYSQEDLVTQETVVHNQALHRLHCTSEASLSHLETR
jgi:hypothetical protein